MPTITTKDGTEIFYKDWGSGQPIVFSHGWPLSADDWDAQMLFFLKHGYRVIAHDRRGHGRSSQTGDGHDMDRVFRTAYPRLRTTPLTPTFSPSSNRESGINVKPTRVEDLWQRCE